jgi:deoxyribodipyrimidine photo-lyase
MPAHVQVPAGPVIDITPPIVNLATATREAKQRLHERRQTAEVKAGKKSVIDKHASRQTLRNRSTSKAGKASVEAQLAFNF